MSVSAYKFSLPFPLDRKSYQQVVKTKNYSNAVQNPGRAITTAVPQISFTRHNKTPSSLAILCRTICITIPNVPTEPLIFQHWRRLNVFNNGAALGGIF